MRISDWSSDVCSSDLVKREWIEGQLSTGEQRRLPVLAAIAGMSVPALVYIALVGGESPELVRGWAIPAATDIAFARSEERRVGKEWVSTCRSRWSPAH